MPVMLSTGAFCHACKHSLLVTLKRVFTDHQTSSRDFTLGQERHELSLMRYLLPDHQICSTDFALGRGNACGECVQHLSQQVLQEAALATANVQDAAHAVLSDQAQGKGVPLLSHWILEQFLRGSQRGRLLPAKQLHLQNYLCPWARRPEPLWICAVISSVHD